MTPKTDTHHFKSSVVSYEITFGLTSLPEDLKVVDGFKFALFLLTKVTGSYFKYIMLKKSTSFIFLNKKTGKYNIVVLDEKIVDGLKETEIQPTEEELKKSFFVEEIPTN
jgi:hypothetical protein